MKSIGKLFYEVGIAPSAGGFGEYQSLPINGEGWADAADLLNEVAGNVGDLYELGVDELPAGIADIRGRIHNEPSRVFSYLHEDGEPAYFGIC